MLKRAAILLLLAAPLFAADAGVHAVAERVDHHYNDLRSLKSAFTETYRGPGIDRVESGTLWLKRPGKMRWDYTQPREKTFVSDGKTAWFYVHGEPQVHKEAVKKLDDLRSPLRYLLGKTRLQKEFDGLQLVPSAEPGIVVLSGVPKSMADRVSRVRLEITAESRIRRIVIEEVDGSTTQFDFANIEENLALDDARFRFTPPPGIEIIEGAQPIP